MFIKAIDIRSFTFGGAEINMIRNMCYERMARNSNRMSQLGVDYFAQIITYEQLLYNEQPLEDENNMLQNMVDYLDSVQYNKEFDDHESVEYDED